MPKALPQPDGSTPKKPTMAQNLGAIILGLVAVKLATYIVTTLWRLITHEDPPQIDQDVPMGKKAAWIALVGAAAGASRQAARDLVKPPQSGPA
ncbi:MAG: DUF4235 domain-containing protein [Actinobacteria bacterium]|jgi:hypothetical protein|nr:DUF4235 domain-containing protein [Actinomycetota bacterium]